MASEIGRPGDPRRFSAGDNQTRWSVVQLLGGHDASDTDHEAWQAAWGRLSQTYRPAMEGHVRRALQRFGGAVRLDEAEDIVQDFLCECLNKNHLLKADRTIGKFRTFLAVLLRRYTSKYVEARNAKKRHPGTPIIPLESIIGQPLAVGDEAVDASFGDEWARCMIEAALPRVRDRSEHNADLLRVLLVDGEATKEALADMLGADASKLPLRKLRAKRMLAQEIWEEVKETVSSRTDFEQEREHLMPYLSRYLSKDEAPSLWGDSPPS